MIIVDQLRPYANAPHGITLWCHMHSDASLQELHDFALSIGCRLSWFQPTPYPHYDLPMFRRGRAIKKGAIALGSKEALKRNFAYRAKHP